jgi:hypothetical protein
MFFLREFGVVLSPKRANFHGLGFQICVTVLRYIPPVGEKPLNFQGCFGVDPDCGGNGAKVLQK